MNKRAVRIPGQTPHAFAGTWIVQTEITNCFGVTLEKFSKMTSINAAGTVQEMSNDGDSYAADAAIQVVLPNGLDNMKTAKEEVRDLLEQLLEDAFLEDILYHLSVRRKIQSGLEAASQCKVIPQNEVEKRMARWLEN